MKHLIVSIIVISLSAAGCKSAGTKDSTLNPKDSVAAQSRAGAEKVNIWIKYNYNQRRGKRLFDHYCVVCHGTKGKGDGFNSYNLDPRPHSLSDSVYIQKLSDDALNRIIAYGGGSVNKSIEMPAYGNTINKKEIGWVIDYIKTLKNGAD